MNHRLLLTLCSAFAVLTASAEAANAQAQTRQLTLGTPIERELTAAERHAYAVRVDSGQFVLVTVRQRGIDAYVSLLDRRGDVVATGRELSGRNGLDSVTLFSHYSGWHWVAVLPRSETNARGTYTITLERLERAGATVSERVDQLFAAWDRPDSPGAAVTVVQDGRVVHAAGYGIAQLEYQIPIEPSTVFHTASVSKQFTAFAVLLLERDGRVSLNDDIRTYLPELPGYGRAITIRHLLHHTSGLRDQWGLLTMAGWRMDDVITADQILRLIERQRELNFAPGTEYLYSNTGFFLLAEIVERVTGQSFSEWTEENIFTPLGMLDTHFHDDHQEIVPNRAYSYLSDPEGGFKKAVLSYANVGATSLFSTVEDMARWAINFETGAVGGAETIRQMRTRGVLNDGDSIDYAMGQAIGSYRGLPVLYHGGADAGFRTYMLRFPHQRVGVIVLSNLAGINAGRLARRTAELCLEDHFTKASNGRSNPAADDRHDTSTEPLAEPSRVESLELAEYTGSFYAEELDARYTLRVVGDTLLATHIRLGTIALIPRGPDIFGTDQWFIRELRFERDETGAISGFRASNGRVRRVLFELTEK